MRIVSVIFVVMMSFSLFAGDNCGNANKKSAKKLSCAERRKECNAKSSAKYNKRAIEYSACKLSKCYDKASGVVKDAAVEEIKIKKELGTIFQKIAEAYDKDDQAAIKELHKAKWELECSKEVAYKKVKMARYNSDFNHKVEKYPNSQKIKDIKSEFDKCSKEYISLTKEINDKRREQNNLHERISQMRANISKVACDERKKSCKK